MKRKVVSVLVCLTMTAMLIMGCGAESENTAATETQTEAVAETTAEAETEEVTAEAETEAEEAVSDEDAAAHVAELIDAIYVQERTETTDADCIAAKEAWDALTDAQKELVEGEEADPDYFGRDTGDASKDDPLNQDEIGENEILVVSFGTSFNDSRAQDIGGIEKAIAAAYPEWSVRRAFTAQIIINHVQARDGEAIDNMDQALERAVNNGVKNLIVQPTHLMQGAEYDEMVEAVNAYADKFETISISKPMLGDVGADENAVNEDKAIVAKAVVDAAIADAGYASADEAAADGVAFVFMGHGTSHKAKVTYSQMQTQMAELNLSNIWIGTVEGEPETTACEYVIDEVAAAGFSKVILRPLMVVAGDHANNDMAGDDEDSWKSMFEASGNFDSVEAQIAGLGRLEEVEKIYVDHISQAAEENSVSLETSKLTDGTYLADFDTDSSMFHVNEAFGGKGVLTVKGDEMTIHLVMPSQKIINLYLGLAADAQKDGAVLIEPTVEEVTYEDGDTEEVFAFDVTVPYLDKEFDLALIGTKGVWYDHKVSVSNVTTETGEALSNAQAKNETEGQLIEVSLEGGTGKASIESPTGIVKTANGYIATIKWSSPNYDYMIVNGTKYETINTEGNSVFEIPVSALDEDINVIADTVAMSKPHEIEYVLNFKSSTMK